jgi:hypothetical protein
MAVPFVKDREIRDERDVPYRLSRGSRYRAAGMAPVGRTRADLPPRPNELHAPEGRQRGHRAPLQTTEAHA